MKTILMYFAVASILVIGTTLGYTRSWNDWSLTPKYGDSQQYSSSEQQNFRYHHRRNAQYARHTTRRVHLTSHSIYGNHTRRKIHLTSHSIYKKQHASRKYNVARKRGNYSVADNTRQSYGKFNFTANRHAGPRPGKWCGWYMRRIFGGNSSYNVARNWANRGTRTGPRVGAVVVWPHHVGVIVGKAKRGWLIKSGNTAGGRVAVQNRRINNAIAFRMVSR